MAKNVRAELKFSNLLPIVELQGKSREETTMRIDVNQAAQPLSESVRSGNPSPASSAARASGRSPLGEDQAQLSGVRVQVLATQVLQFPEVRQEKVSALRQVVLGGSYQPSSKQVAEAVFAHLLVLPAA
jgi:flagellar biosynthesis anti-sigma factor FlgM